MKFFYIDKKFSELSDNDPTILNSLKNTLSINSSVKEVFNPEDADVILIQENDSYKNFHYIKELLSDPIISKYPEKVFTINTDDSATGLLRGLYTCLPSTRISEEIYTAVPYVKFPNDLVLNVEVEEKKNPKFLAVWRGNIKSNKLRSKLVASLESKERCRIEQSLSWMKFEKEEQEIYVDLIKNSKFSICPAGWAAATYRIYESMALGRCPVILADDFVPPKGPDWDEFALFYPENKIDDLHFFLLCNEHLAETYGKKALQAWNKFFSPYRISNYYADALVNLIEKTPETSRAKEMARWKSEDLHWSNRWSFPQRILQKLKNRKMYLIPPF